MKTSESIKTIAPLLLKAQQNMVDVKKGSSNPFFKSKYADLNSIREVSIPVLNELGISVLQPTVEINGKNYVETILLHTSGEFVSAQTAIINQKGTAQDEGSGQSYARRYGLQSLLNIGAVDDDAESTMKREKSSVAKKVEETVEKALQAAVAKVDPNTDDIEAAAKEFTKQIAPVVKSSFKKSTPAPKADEWEN